MLILFTCCSVLPLVLRHLPEQAARNFNQSALEIGWWRDAKRCWRWNVCWVWSTWSGPRAMCNHPTRCKIRW